MAALDQITLIKLADIEPGERYRKDPTRGVDALAASIDSVGLLQPIVVLAPNGDGRYPLVFGQRRLLAHQHLGMDEIEARVAHDMDEADRLLAERDENVCHLPMTPSEANACKKAREALLAPLAEERKAAGRQAGGQTTKAKAAAKTGAKTPAKTSADAPTGTAKNSSKARAKTTAEAAAEGTGYSGATLAKVNKIEQWAFDPELPQEIQAYIAGKLDEINAASKPKIDPVYREIETVVNAAKAATAQGKPATDAIPDGALADAPAVYLNQAKVLKAAITGISRHVGALQAAFLGAANLDPDTNPDMVSEGFKELKLLATSINKTAKAAVEITA